jgi:septum formation protein
VSAPPAPPLVLASTSPRRREILQQLRIPFDVVPPSYEELEGDPVAHAIGKARSVAGVAGDRPVLGCDTEVVCGGRVFGKPADSTDAEEMLEALAGKTHEVVSGLVLLTPGWEEVHQEVTRVTFRPLDARDLANYVASGEWEGRAGAYAIQGLGWSSGSRATTSTSSGFRPRCSCGCWRNGLPACTASAEPLARAEH